MLVRIESLNIPFNDVLYITFLVRGSHGLLPLQRKFHLVQLYLLNPQAKSGGNWKTRQPEHSR